MKKIWTTKEGEKIPLKKMTDSHLKNAIRFLEKRESLIINEISRLCQIMSVFEGEMAIYSVEDEIAALDDAPLESFCEPYAELLREAKRRKLDAHA